MPKVDVEFRSDAALITAEVTFTRGQHRGPLTIFCSYGNPGIPRAFEVELLAVDPGFFLPKSDIHGEKLTAKHAKQAPSEASLVIGVRSAAGQVVSVPETILDGALRPSGLAALRLRWIHVFTAPHGTSRSVLVRSTASGQSLPLGILNIHTSNGRLEKPWAERCGVEPSISFALSGERATATRQAPSVMPQGSGDLCMGGEIFQ